MAAEIQEQEIDRLLYEELEVLQSIYIDELSVQHDESGHPNNISLQLHPATGEDVDKKFVCMTLIFDIPLDYPDMIPEIVIRNPRGIAEEEIQSLHEDMIQLAEERCGGPMLYEIIELAKESLTEGNVPHCPCTICYEHFNENDNFTKTECYHYFHRSCLSRYISHTLESITKELEDQPLHKKGETENCEQKIPCPVCRENITYEPDILNDSLTTLENDADYQLPDYIIQWQKEMTKLLEAQKQKGGVIDVEAEKNKFLVAPDETIVIQRSLSPSQNSEKKLAEVTDRKNDAKGNTSKEYLNEQHRHRPSSHTYVKGRERGKSYRDQNFRKDTYRDRNAPRSGRFNESYNRRNPRQSDHRERSYQNYNKKQTEADKISDTANIKGKKMDSENDAKGKGQDKSEKRFENRDASIHEIKEDMKDKSIGESAISDSNNKSRDILHKDLKRFVDSQNSSAEKEDLEHTTDKMKNLNSDVHLADGSVRDKKSDEVCVSRTKERDVFDVNVSIKDKNESDYYSTESNNRNKFSAKVSHDVRKDRERDNRFYDSRKNRERFHHRDEKYRDGKKQESHYKGHRTYNNDGGYSNYQHERPQSNTERRGRDSYWHKKPFNSSREYNSARGQNREKEVKGKNMSLSSGDITAKAENWDLDIRENEQLIEKSKPEADSTAAGKVDKKSTSDWKSDSDVRKENKHHTEAEMKVSRGRGRGRRKQNENYKSEGRESKLDSESIQEVHKEMKKASGLDSLKADRCDINSRNSDGVDRKKQNERSAKDNEDVKTNDNDTRNKRPSAPPGFALKRPPPGFDNIRSEKTRISPPPGFQNLEDNS